jgi:subtilisin family serine protease
MARKIVLIRSHEWLAASWNSRSFGPAGADLDATVKVAGVEFDEGYHPVRVLSKAGVQSQQLTASGYNYSDVGAITTYAVRAEFADAEAVERLKHDRAGEVVGVYADPSIQAAPTPYCGRRAVGTDRDVAEKLGLAQLREAGCTGKRVRLAVVDTGIDGSMIPVAGGWSPVPGYKPGTGHRGHGTMCAYDARIAAPDARILDYALLQSTGNTWTAFLSDAIAAFGDLLELLHNKPGALIVSNSWAMFDRNEDAPIGSPENYSANPDHPFNQIVGSLVAAGADVFFAAGNCGKECPDGRCGGDDIGPGASIHGANSHPDVFTVAAITVTQRRLGYSSQGPGGLAQRKPDVAAYSHFKGSGVYPADGGTSAACPVAAGVIAALRQRVTVSRVPPLQMKAIVQRTALDVNTDGWDSDLGYGVIDAPAAIKALKLKPITG